MSHSPSKQPPCPRLVTLFAEPEGSFLDKYIRSAVGPPALALTLARVALS